jgi:TolB-like protein/DNA-binding winged helix-turn-helix (wHTH) protein/Flp pilus assembly protein TadD
MSESLYRFAEFQLDCGSFELRRQGRAQKSERISLERIPMELLILLLERQGSVVTRQEIVDRLWGKDVFVDTEHGINTAIRKVRQALKDDPDNPRFVLTVTGKGYRFVAEKAEDRKISGRSPGVVDLTDADHRRSKEEPIAPVVGEISGDPSKHLPPAPLISASRQRIFMIATLVLALCAAGLLASNAGGVRDRLFPPNRAAQIHSIAVIPLANLSGDSSQEYFADGMTDELITALAKNHSLRVVSRTSAMQYKGVQRPVRDIARELGVDGVLEGSVSRSSNRVHMTVQLIYAPTDSHVWAESYDRDLNQAYSLPEELSQTVAKEVKAATSLAPAPRYINPEAHDAYLRGRFSWITWDFPQAMTNFQKAIQLQPDYAAAWSWLGATYQLEAIEGSRPASEVSAQAKSAALKALELDDSLPDAHSSMCGWYHFFAWDLPRADAECRRAIELSPSDGEFHYLYHWVLMAMERQDEAAQEEKRAVELEPFARAWGLGNFYLGERQFDLAINELQEQSRFRPYDSGVPENLSTAYWLKGMYKESEQESEKLLQLQGRSDSVIALHKAWERGGEKAVAQWGVEDIKAQARKQYVSPYALAEAVSYTGDKEATLKYLTEAFGQHDPNLINIQSEAVLDFIHSDPRYQALVRKIGLQLAP